MLKVWHALTSTAVQKKMMNNNVYLDMLENYALPRLDECTNTIFHQDDMHIIYILVTLCSNR